LTQPFREAIHLNCAVRAVRRHAHGVTLTLADGTPREFDAVMLATHTDQTLQMLADPSDAERDVLGQIPYQPNLAVLHTDERLLPRRKAAWASWNYMLHQ
jgi:predicted NAD/FAD-binding protein